MEESWSQHTQTFADLLAELVMTSGAPSNNAAARATGLDQGQFSRLLRSEVHPTRAVVERIAAGLNLEPFDRRRLLSAAGYAPVLWDATLEAVSQVLSDDRVSPELRSRWRASVELQAELLRDCVAAHLELEEREGA